MDGSFQMKYYKFDNVYQCNFPVHQADWGGGAGKNDKRRHAAQPQPRSHGAHARGQLQLQQHPVCPAIGQEQEPGRSRDVAGRLREEEEEDERWRDTGEAEEHRVGGRPQQEVYEDGENRPGVRNALE